jgi:hypothetical protein
MTTTTTTITVTKRDGSTKSVESPYTDEQVIQRLWAHTGYEFGAYRSEIVINWTGKLRSRFARDLAVRADHRDLTAKQVAWVHILVVEHEEREARPAPELPCLERIMKMMDAASEKMSYPKITLQTESGRTVHLRRSGNRSATPGVIEITDGKAFGYDEWFGRISRDGKLRTSRRIPEEVLALLLEFDRNPQASAEAYGHQHGSCCFCTKRLTDERSVTAGYGPVCAERYGLSWGETN